MWARFDGAFFSARLRPLRRPIQQEIPREFRHPNWLAAFFVGVTIDQPFLPERDIRMKQSVNVLALVKNGHRYVFLYDDESQDSVLGQLSASASDPELDFTWYDAAILAQRVRRMAEERAQYGEMTFLNDAA